MKINIGEVKRSCLKKTSGKIHRKKNNFKISSIIKSQQLRISKKEIVCIIKIRRKQNAIINFFL